MSEEPRPPPQRTTEHYETITPSPERLPIATNTGRRLDTLQTMLQYYVEHGTLDESHIRALRGPLAIMFTEDSNQELGALLGKIYRKAIDEAREMVMEIGSV